LPAEDAEDAADGSVCTANAIGAHAVTASIAAITAAAALTVFAFAFEVDRFILPYPFKTAERLSLYPCRCLHRKNAMLSRDDRLAQT